MRITFSIVAVLGLILTGFAIFQIQFTRDYCTRVKYVQFKLAEDSTKEVAKVHQQGAVFTGQTLGDALSPKLDGVDALEQAWFVAASVGVVVFLIGAIGIIVTRKPDALPNMSPGLVNKLPQTTPLPHSGSK